MMYTRPLVDLNYTLCSSNRKCRKFSSSPVYTTELHYGKLLLHLMFLNIPIYAIDYKRNEGFNISRVYPFLQKYKNFKMYFAKDNIEEANILATFNFELNLVATKLTTITFGVLNQVISLTNRRNIPIHIKIDWCGYNSYDGLVYTKDNFKNNFSTSKVRGILYE